MNYAKALQLIQTARSPANGKPLANNTRLEARDSGAYAVKLHATDVVTFHADGSFTLNSGGWKTVTTKERMNRFAPASISSNRGVWSVSYQGRTYLYADGMTFYPDGRVTGDAPESTTQADKKMRAKVKQYAVAFTDKLFAGEITAPSAGDCWGCCMKAADGSAPMGGANHIHGHLEEAYYVPSLLVNALDYGSSIAAKQTAQAFMQGKPEYAFSKDRSSFLGKQIETAIRKHCLRQLGMAS